MNILSKLLATDGFITVNKTLIKAYGLNEAVIIGELCSEYNYWNEHNQLKDDKFYSSRENIEENTGLSKHLQRKALEHLIDEGIVEVYKEGMPATNYYKINFNKLLTVFTTSGEWCEPQVVNGVNLNNNINNKNKEKQSISKDIDCRKNFHFGHSNEVITESNDINNALTFKSLYEEHCYNLPRISKLTDTRIKAINKIIKKYSREEIITVLDNANNSEFLKGNNDRGWKANIDFILREDKFVSILEGRYNGRPNSGKKVSTDMGYEHRVMTAEQKRQFKEDIASGKAEKF